MAYVSDQNDPTQQQQLGQQTQNPAMQPQTASTGGGSSPIGSPQGSAAVPNATKAPPVQDLGAYLSANAPQAVGMGQTIANGLNQQANTVTGDINSGTQAVNQQVKQSAVTPNSDLVNQAASNPSGFVQDPNNVTAFQKQRDANYTGPTNFESTPYNQTLTQEVSNAQANAPDINKPGGVQQLVRGQEKNPTQGMANLDSLILQENPSAVAPIQQALPQFAHLGDYLGNARSGVNTNIQNAITGTQAAKQGVQDRFLTGSNAVVPGFQQGLQNELAQAQQNANTYNTDINRYISNLNTNQPFNADLKASGLADDNFYNQLIPSAPGALTTAPTQANTATSADYAKDAALEQLLGNGYTNALNPGNAGQAGSFQIPGNVPQNENILNILDRLVMNNPHQFDGNRPLTGTLNPTLVSTHSNIADSGLFGATGNAQTAALNRLLSQTNSLYPGSGYLAQTTVPNDNTGRNYGYHLTS